MKIKKPKIKVSRPKINPADFKDGITKKRIDFKTVRSLVKRDLLNYFSSPLAFIVLGLFVVIVSIIFFGVFQFLQFGTNDLTQMFTAIAFSFIIIVPALTMGSISREKQSGTIEFILTQPITEFEFLISKFLSNAVILFLSLLLTLPLVFVVGSMTQLDFGQILIQYLGGFLLGLCFISIGIAVSSFFKSEITSLLVAIAISILFVISGSQLLNFFPLQLQSIVEKLSLLSHYQSISRGVVDIRDLFYFIAFISVFLSLGYYSLVRNKYPSKHPKLVNAKIALAVMVFISLLIGVLGQIIPGRIDFTSNQKYTLSAESRNLIGSLQDTVNVKFYASGNLPTEFQAISRDVSDILRDYALASNGKVSVTQLDPQSDNAAKDGALNEGLKELVFAVDSNDASQRVSGFLGVTFKYKEKNEFINVTQDVTTDLEYQISKRIKKVSVEDKLDVGFLTNNVSQNLSTTYTTYATQLRDLYDVVDLTLTKENPSIPENVKTIIIAGPTGKFEDEVISNLKKFYNDGGSIILMADTIQVSEDTGIPSVNEGSLKDLFSDYGITLDDNFVYDLEQNNLIGIPRGGFVVPAPYPLWFIANATADAQSVVKNVSNISMLWGGSISVDENKLNGAKLSKLFETTDSANTQSGENIKISVEESLKAKSDDSKKLVALALENEKGGRAIIAGDSDFVSDQIVQELASRRQGLDSLNNSFALGSVEWASKDNQLSAISARNRLPTRIAIMDKDKASLIGVGAIFPILIVAGTGMFIPYRRKKLTKEVYTVT